MNPKFLPFLAAVLSVSMAAIQKSSGYYRIPYAQNTNVHVSRDVDDHTPIGRVDMHGHDASSYRIVAAASGHIRYIEDSHTGQTTMKCYNNYVWIEHPNGEWTKYSHLRKNSVTMSAGRSEGDWVKMGDFLGYEGDVGCATGDHLHFEVAVLRSIDPITTIGGFVLDNGGSKRNRDPRICGISGGLFNSGEFYTAEWQPENFVPGATEVARHGLPIEYYQCTFNHMISAGYEPTWIDVFNSRGKAYVNVIGRKKSGVGYWFHNRSGRSYNSLFKRLTRRGYKLMTVDSYLLGRSVRYAGFFKRQSGPALVAYHGISQSSHQSRFNELTADGFLPTSLSVVSINGQRRYTGLYKKQSQGSILVRSTMALSDYQEAFDDNLGKGRRPAYLNGYTHNGKAYIVSIFNSVTPSGGQYRHGLTGSEYQSEYESARENGQLTRIVTGYEQRGSKYAAAWR